jgi:hypothetical protein
MPKEDAERARPPAHQARTKHPPAHPQRAAQPHRHPDRAKGAHEPPVTMGTDRKDRHESPARKPVRPAATPQPDSASEQGADLRMLMKRGLISEKALGRNQEGGLPIVGEPALVGEGMAGAANASDLPNFGAGPLTAQEQMEAVARHYAGQDKPDSLARRMGQPAFSPHFWEGLRELLREHDLTAVEEERRRGVPDTSYGPRGIPER